MERHQYFEEYGQSFTDFKEILISKRPGLNGYDVILTIQTYTQHGVLMNNFCISYLEESRVTSNHAIAVLLYDNIDLE